jgi:hypothetical protein
MTSRKPYLHDEFDRLVRDTLKAKVESQVPSNHVWNRIRADLGISRPLSKYFFASRLSLMVQLTIIFLLVTVGGINLRQNLDIQPLPTESTMTLTYYVPISEERSVVTEETVIARVITPPSDEYESQVLTRRLEYRLGVQNDRRPKSPPLLIPPTDVVPHLDSPEGRSLVSGPKLSSSLAQSAIIFPGTQFGLGIIR